MAIFTFLIIAHFPMGGQVSMYHLFKKAFHLNYPVPEILYNYDTRVKVSCKEANIFVYWSILFNANSHHSKDICSFQDIINFGESKYQLWDSIIDLDHVRKKRKNHVSGTIYIIKMLLIINAKNVVNYIPDREMTLYSTVVFKRKVIRYLFFHKSRRGMLLINFTNAMTYYLL